MSNETGRKILLQFANLMKKHGDEIQKTVAGEETRTLILDELALFFVEEGTDLFVQGLTFDALGERFMLDDTGEILMMVEDDDGEIETYGTTEQMFQKLIELLQWRISIIKALAE